MSEGIDAAPALAASALIYFGAAALRKPSAVWPLFFGAVVVIFATELLGGGDVDPTWVLLALAVAYLIGADRGDAADPSTDSVTVPVAATTSTTAPAPNRTLTMVGTGTATAVPERTDTIMLCQGERAILETRFRYPGRYMFHAHQSEFAELGWMGLFEAVERPA
jgi:hypothetical protein